MSQSPEAVKGGEALERYQAGWDATMRLLREGRSFSGHERHRAYLNCGAAGPQRRGTARRIDPETAAGPVAFANVSAVSGLDFDDDGRAMSLVDWDHDGDVDVWIYNRTGPRLRLMINQTTSPGSADAPRSVAFRLKGVKCHPNAIGARVEVILDGPAPGVGGSEPRPGAPLRRPLPLIQTLRAGDGYLSQSSKWLHFGLGADALINRVVVRWPGGEAETFANARPGGRYRLVQGTGVAVRAEARRSAVSLAPAEQRVAVTVDGPRVVVPVRLVAPQLEHVRFDASHPRPIRNGSKPLLVNLWAAWCAPCVAELKALTQREDDLRAAGVNVFALSVDGLSQEEVTTAADARNLLAQVGFPFDAGLATPELLEKIRVLMASLFQVRRPDGVPMSLLLDSKGRLAVIYRGRVEIDALLRDVAAIDSVPQLSRLQSPALQGRWHSPVGLRAAVQATAPFAQRYPQDAARYLQTGIEQMEQTAALVSPEDRPGRRHRLDLALLHTHRGAALAKLGKTAETIESLRIAVRHDPKSAKRHFALARVLFQAGRPADAREHYLKALRIDPRYADALIGLGNLLIATGKPEYGMVRLFEALRLEPDRLIAHQSLAITLRALGRFDEAIHHCREALRIRPDDPTALTNLGLALAAEGRPDDAIAHLREALDRNPASMQLHLTLGTCFLSQGTLDEAAVHFEEATRLDTEHAEAPMRLGSVRQRQGRLDDAISAFETALHRRGDHTDAHLKLAAVLQTSGRRAEAFTHLRRAVELEPGRPAALNKLAWTLATDSDTTRRDPVEAVRLATRAVDLTKRRQANCLFTLATAHAATGRYDLAVDVAEEALEVASKSGRDELTARIRERLGEYRQQAP